MVHMNQKKVNLAYEIILALLRKPLHGRELSKILRFPLSTIQRKLQFLSSENILDHELVGKNKIYSLKDGLAAKRYIYNAENYKFIRSIRNNLELQGIIENVLSIVKDNITLCSVSGKKKIEKINILIDTVDKKIKKDIEKFDKRISVNIVSAVDDLSSFRDTFDDSVIIRGVEEYYEKVKY